MLTRMGQEQPSSGPQRPSGGGSGTLRRVQSVLVETLSRRLARLCHAAGLTPETACVADEVLRHVIVPWSRFETSVRDPNPIWHSEISDDNTPLELSVTLSPRGSEVRVLFEAQGEEPSLESQRASALCLHAELERNYGADLTRFRSVQDLFLPHESQGAFALWSAVVFENGRRPTFKAYFNPQAQGPGRAPVLVAAALTRLGLPKAWRYLENTLARRGPQRDELKYFALDLSGDGDARVKVYVRHHDATLDDLALAATAAPGASLDEAREFVRAMSGDSPQFAARAPFSCAAFVGRQSARPTAVTQYVPVCAYAEHDAEVEQRVTSYMRDRGLDEQPYRRVLASFARRSLARGVGMQSWVALRRLDGVPRLTVYLASEARHVFPPNSEPASTRAHLPLGSPAELLRWLDSYPLVEHPALAELASGPERSALATALCRRAIALLGSSDISAAIGARVEPAAAPTSEIVLRRLLETFARSLLKRENVADAARFAELLGPDTSLHQLAPVPPSTQGLDSRGALLAFQAIWREIGQLAEVLTPPEVDATRQGPVAH
jgi:DMATS type aromatic prenyltransferase